MADLCYLTFEADVVSEPTRSDKGNVFFLAKTRPAGKADITIRVMLRGAAAETVLSEGDRIYVTNGNVYVGAQTPDYLFNIAIEKAQFIHVVSKDDGIVNVDKVTGGF